MKKFFDKIKYFSLRKKLFILFFSILSIFLSLYILAFIMKDKANNEFNRYLCKEFVNGPRNVIALVINKITKKELLSYKTKVFTPTKRKILIENEREAGKNMVLKEIETEKLKQERLKQERLEQEKKTQEKPAGMKLLEELEKELVSQKEIDEMLLEELNSEEYTFENPYIILNPYGGSPLTALILFCTNEDSKIKIEINGKDNESELKFNFEKKSNMKKHIIPVYGLYSNKNNKIKLSCTTLNGITVEKEHFIKTEPLPKTLNDMELISYPANRKKYQEGFNFSYAGINHIPLKMAFDINGEIRWFFSTPYLLPTNFNNANSIFISKGSYHYGDNLIIEKNLLGKIISVYYNPYGNHHEIYLKDNYIYLAGSNNDGTVEDIVVALDRKTGKEVFTLDYKKILPRTRVVSPFYSNTDWIHINAILEHNSNIIISSNTQSAIVKTSKTGEIKWIFSDPKGFVGNWMNKVLIPKGKNFEYSYNQHAPMILPDYDNNSDTLDILVFDNGLSRNFMNKDLQDKMKLNVVIEPPLYSRMVHYRIDEKNMTVEQIWEYGKNRPELYSPWRGDADLLENGNIIGLFQRDKNLYNSSKESDSIYIEVDKNKNIIWECFAISRLANNRHLDYRIERLKIYTEAANDIKLGAIAQNLIPKEVYKKYGLKKEEAQEIVEEIREEIKNEN